VQRRGSALFSADHFVVCRTVSAEQRLNSFVSVSYELRAKDQSELSVGSGRTDSTPFLLGMLQDKGLILLLFCIV
jgi:hypothetical protein